MAEVFSNRPDQRAEHEVESNQALKKAQSNAPIRQLIPLLPLIPNDNIMKDRKPIKPKRLGKPIKGYYRSV